MKHETRTAGEILLELVSLTLEASRMSQDAVMKMLKATAGKPTEGKRRIFDAAYTRFVSNSRYVDRQFRRMSKMARSLNPSLN